MRSGGEGRGGEGRGGGTYLVRAQWLAGCNMDTVVYVYSGMYLCIWIYLYFLSNQIETADTAEAGEVRLVWLKKRALGNKKYLSLILVLRSP